jgi:hypothetical protein
LGRNRWLGSATLQADLANGSYCGAGDDSAIAVSVLGADGSRHYGWFGGGYLADHVVPACALCGVVQSEADLK